jgi:hypothetical protein
MIRTKARKMVDELQKAIEAVGDKYGVKFEGVRLSYSTTSIRLSAKGILAVDGSTEKSEKVEFERSALRKGIDPNMYGKLIRLPNVPGEFKVVKISTKAKKYPVIVRRASDGAEYKIGANYALSAVYSV